MSTCLRGGRPRRSERVWRYAIHIHEEESGRGRFRVGQFDCDATALAARLAGQGTDARRELTDWVLGLVSARSGMQVLDLGSGLGIPAVALAEIVGPDGRVVCVDRSSSALESLLGSLSNAAGPVIVPVCQDFDALASDGAPAAVFDRVTSVYSLYYSRAPLQTLSALRSMLRPDGRLVVAGPLPQSNRTFRELCRRAYGRPVSSRTRATRFMTELLPAVLPRFFPYVSRQVLITRAVFTDAPSLLSYWRSHNWYRPGQDDQIRRVVDAAFREATRVTFTKHTGALIGSAAPTKVDAWRS